MTEFDITYKDIKLRVICDKNIKSLIEELMTGHSYIKEIEKEATYTLIINDKEIGHSNEKHFKMVDKWFDNATCDVYIDNSTKKVFLTNISASSQKYNNLLIQYFTCNLFNRLLEERGYIAFHSSCVEKNNIGISFIGPRNSGKTNCMLNLMNIGFNSITNDKLAVHYDGKNLNGYGVAQDVSIRMSSAFQSQKQNKKYLDYCLKNGIQISKENMLDGNNIHLESTYLAKLNNVYQIPSTNLNYIFFPKYNSDIEEIVLHEIPREQVISILKNQRLALVHDTTNFLKEIETDNYDFFEEDKIINEMANLKCFEIVQGENTFKSYIKVMKKILNN